MYVTLNKRYQNKHKTITIVLPCSGCIFILIACIFKLCIIYRSDTRFFDAFCADIFNLYANKNGSKCELPAPLLYKNILLYRFLNALRQTSRPKVTSEN